MQNLKFTVAPVHTVRAFEESGVLAHSF